MTKRILFISLILIGCLASCGGRLSTNSNEVATQPNDNTESVTVDCSDFQKQIDETYNFRPSKLTEAQQSAKSAEMDKVWEHVKLDSKKNIPCLASALRSPTANKFFLFDGSTLLFSLDQSEDTKKLLIESFSKTDLEDIALQSWIGPILRLSVDGFDTSAAGEAWLKAEDPGYYLPQHGTSKVNKEIGALAIYGSMDEKFATPALVSISTQAGHPGQDIAVDLLTKQVTMEARMALKNLDKEKMSPQSRKKVEGFIAQTSFIEPRKGEPKITREKYVGAFESLAKGDSRPFMELASEVTDGEKDAVAVLKAEDIPLVRRARRFFASTGTPHAPEWYQSFTDILMYMVLKPATENKVDQKKTV